MARTHGEARLYALARLNILSVFHPLVEALADVTAAGERARELATQRYQTQLAQMEEERKEDAKLNAANPDIPEQGVISMKPPGPWETPVPPTVPPDPNQPATKNQPIPMPMPPAQ